jgi:glyoxylase-like metal-dependent hydrolase (beta-lactamase superfamily II)
VNGKTPATWPASTSTLISGDRDALLVDALMTEDEGNQLAGWVRSTGQEPSAIFVTHGHADHFFGAGPVLAAVPDAELIASDQHVIDEARAEAAPEGIKTWTAWFPGQLASLPAVPALADSAEFDVEDHPVEFRTVGGADGTLGTVAHVPEARVICAGDVAYNSVHMWPRNSTPGSRQTWLESLDAIAVLKPAAIIAGPQGSWRARRRCRPRARPVAPLPRGLRPDRGQVGHARRSGQRNARPVPRLRQSAHAARLGL